MLMASTPARSALSAWRTATHLWMIRMPASFNLAQCSDDFGPAVSTTLMPPSMMASMYSAYGGGEIVGNTVMLTPNGWSVIARQRAISLAKCSGVGCVNPVSMPNAPALETADAISAVPTHCMPPWMIG